MSNRGKNILLEPATSPIAVNREKLIHYDIYKFVYFKGTLVKQFKGYREMMKESRNNPENCQIEDFIKCFYQRKPSLVQDVIPIKRPKMYEGEEEIIQKLNSIDFIPN